MSTIDDLVRRHRRLSVIHIEQWIARGLLRPVDADMPVREIRFGPTEDARVQLLYELTEDMQFDDDVLETVVGLIDQVHALRHDFDALLRAVAEQPEHVRRAIAESLKK